MVYEGYIIHNVINVFYVLYILCRDGIPWGVNTLSVFASILLTYRLKFYVIILNSNKNLSKETRISVTYTIILIRNFIKDFKIYSKIERVEICQDKLSDII